MKLDLIKAAVRDIPDFPAKGIIFKDITPVLKSPELFRAAVDLLCEPYRENPPGLVVGIDARGFIFASAMAYRLGTGFVPIRKKGKLPHVTVSADYALEYGTATVEIHEDAAGPGDRVVVVDDLLATGGTLAAAVGLLQGLGAKVEGISVLIELAFLKGRAKLPGETVRALIQY